MKNKTWEALKGSVGFYLTMAICLTVIGVSGWYLLKEEPAPAQTPEVEAKVSAPATVPMPEKPIQPKKPAVETIQPVIEEPAPPPAPVEASAPVVPEAPQLVVSPLKGSVLAAFSVDQLAYDATMEDWRIHDGMDIAAKPGTSVLAACAGTVAAVEDDPMMGTTVVIDHGDGCLTTYANLQSQPVVKPGEDVSAGQIIGAVGTTAAAESAQPPHLHFAVTQDGDAVDPEVFLAK